MRVPHPLHYLLQKQPIRDQRQQQGKQAKDQADAYFVILGLRAAWASWRTQWTALRGNPEQAAWLRRAQNGWRTLYDPMRAIGATEVVSQYPHLRVKEMPVA